MTVAGLRIEYWSARPGGGFEAVNAPPQSGFAVVWLPTLTDGRETFTLPEHADLLDGFLVGLAHGQALGTRAHRDEMRALLGFTASRDIAVIQGVRRATR